ncbi:MAG: Hsp70 family protein, partial [Deltaproteobacteria bacterium]|nr:Hsp70 family protein [Deltaproteobacteria bacterium]
ANGILHVSAKDLGTGREQSIKITASSGLSEEEIRKMVRDAEAHAEEDHKKKALAEARNHADTLIYATEKSMTDLGDKIDATTRSTVEDAITRLKKTMEGNDAEEIKRLSEELTKASHKLAEALYAKTAQAEAAGAGGPGAAGGEEQAKKGEEEVVEAEFEEVK